ncbi:MAG: hypothetical protein KFB95_04770 [Simkaniaceae bacterium]|nr:MAG: hypothetical protein KFB95_04770 [Simkaniaceae bacterium]
MAEEIFWSYKIFKNSPKATISYTQIARLYGISVPCAQSYIKRDLQLGMIFRDNSDRLPWKKVSYYLTPLGYSHLHKDLATPAPRESY